MRLQGDDVERVVITRSIIGIFRMQVCAEKDVTDEEILDVCNSENPAGTSNGWCRVIRAAQDETEENAVPVACVEDSNRLHFLVEC